MPKQIRLSELVNEIDDVIQSRFAGQTHWISAEITDVKKQPGKRWCFLKFIEKDGQFISTEIKGVFWSNTYQHVERFEKLTGRPFANGLEIICLVRVRFHKRYGIDLEVLEIDHAYTLGKLELEKQQTLDRLVKENPESIILADGQYITRNKSLSLPVVVQRIALITAPSSDGQRDFKQEMQGNAYGYAFQITEFLTQVQGDQASRLIVQLLQTIEVQKTHFDIVVLVRGGGSQTDFKPFDDYDLAKYIASFPLPVFTGIGHDSNTSIVDLMARQHKTPTKVATSIINHNFNFETAITTLKERFFDNAETKLQQAIENIKQIRRTVKAYSPATILNKGYAIITSNGKIIVNPEQLHPKDAIKTILRDQLVHSTVTQLSKNENDF